MRRNNLKSDDRTKGDKKPNSHDIAHNKITVVKGVICNENLEWLEWSITGEVS